jgi:hypothetical protein
MKFLAQVYEPMYDFNNKRYLRVTVPADVCQIIEKMHATRSHMIMHKNVDDPIDGNVLKIKVPYRYRRVMCNVKGRPIQSLIKGDTIEVDIEFKGVWNVENHSGFSWVLSSSTFSSSSSLT